MVGRKRQATTASRSRNAVTGVPDVYQEMLAEAGVDSPGGNLPERPLKRRRAGPGPVQLSSPVSHAGSSRRGLDDDHEDEVGSEADGLPMPNVQTMEKDSDDEDDDDENMTFEDVAFEAWMRGEEPPEPAAEAPRDLELNLSAQQAANIPLQKAVERRKPLTRDEKDHRTQLHQTHLLCLLSHVARRNHWCNDGKVQELLRSHVADKTITYLTPGSNLSQFGRTNSLKTGLEQTGSMWKTKFEVTERGLRRALWAEDPEHLQNYEPPDDMDSCVDRDEFREAARKLQGSRDVGAQLYCALLRSVGVRARLVCSLQPLACAPGAPTLSRPKAKKAVKPSKEEKLRAAKADAERRQQAARAEIEASVGRGSAARRRLGHPNATAYNFEPAGPSPKKTTTSTFKNPRSFKESPHPVYWVEVLDVGHQKWQPADAVVTHTFWKPKGIEPPITDRENSLSYVIAFDTDGTAKDVTRRYAKTYTAKTRKLRVETATDSGDRWWRKAMKRFRKREPEDLDQIEDNELTNIQAREPMPRNVQDFKDHPIYALERHLRRHEVLVAEATPSGTVGAGTKGPLEKIYRRKDVRVARSADKWYRLGRDVKPNEVPAKWLRKKAQPRGSLFDEDEDNQGDSGIPIYTEEQTELYEAPPVRNGRVPKNKFGNIDAYVPSMIPRGAKHLQHEHAARAAFILGVDYAPALAGFSFKGRHGTAVLNGIVVATEYEDAIGAVIEGLGDAEQEAEDDRRRLRALKAWRKLLMGLRIRERIWAGVSEEERRQAEDVTLQEVEEKVEEEMADVESDVTEEFDMELEDEGGGGGFLIE